ncbi:hypothetical protein AGMMS49957_10010 [Synergistales bacterium]|nr:hypothetical protein AGMMS49957_10010 [Synergistales bacterium]
MKSAVAISYEIDDAEIAAQELADAIKEKLKFEENSIGVLFCDADMDSAAVTGELKKLLGFEVAGMTSLATLDRGGRYEAAAMLTVLTSDDCLFGAAASKPLEGDGVVQEIKDTYRRIMSQAAGQGYEKPGVMFAFCPSVASFSGDTYSDALAEEAPGVPIIGGAASDDYQYTEGRTFLSGEAYNNSIVIVGVWGNVKPVFAIRHVTSPFAERVRRITDATGNIVRRVGDETFIEYLKGFGFNTNVDEILLAFNANPMKLTRENEDKDEAPIMRHIVGLDHETGAGMFGGDVPVGALGNICLIKRDDIKTSCRESMNALLAEGAKQEGYTYSTVFCVSCSGRNLILGHESDAEGAILTSLLPEGASLMGTYCYGEVGPVRYKDGVALNRFHNCSITLCMF